MASLGSLRKRPSELGCADVNGEFACNSGGHPIDAIGLYGHAFSRIS